jgi:hypothetical protein
MTVGPTEVVNGISVAHIVVFSGVSLRIRGLVFVEFVFVNVHAKSESLFANQILQFGEGFFAEIAEFQQIGNVKLDQIGQGTDLSGLEAIESSDRKVHISQIGLQQFALGQEILVNFHRRI